MAVQGNKGLLVYEKGSYELGCCINLEIILDSFVYMAVQGNKGLLVYEKGSYELGCCINLEIILDSFVYW